MIFVAVNIRAEECEAISTEFNIPIKLKTRGKPKMARWEQVDEILNGIGQKLERASCEFTFGELFRYGKEEEVYFPLTNTVVRVVPEQSLSGIKVYNNDGDLLGFYANKVRYERSGGLEFNQTYSLYYFQYSDLADKLQSVGHRLLLDDFAIRWIDIRDKVAVSGK